MTYLLNGETRYGFEDLVARSGYFIAQQVFADIVSTCDSWIDIETGETGSMPPERVNEGAVFDEIGWADLCRHADEIAARNPGTRHLGDALWNRYKAISGRSDDDGKNSR